MLKITKQINKNTEVTNIIKCCKKELHFEIDENENKQDFFVTINFQIENDSKYLVGVNVNEYKEDVYLKNIGEFDDFYNILDDKVFNTLDHFLSKDLKNEEVGLVCTEILDKIKEVIEWKNIIVD